MLSREHQPTQTMLKQLVKMRQRLGNLQEQETIARELESQRNPLAIWGSSARPPATQGPIAGDEAGTVGLSEHRTTWRGDKSPTVLDIESGVLTAWRWTIRPWRNCWTACRIRASSAGWNC